MGPNWRTPRLPCAVSPELGGRSKIARTSAQDLLARHDYRSQELPRQSQESIQPGRHRPSDSIESRCSSRGEVTERCKLGPHRERLGKMAGEADGALRQIQIIVPRRFSVPLTWTYGSSPSCRRFRPIRNTAPIRVRQNRTRCLRLQPRTSAPDYRPGGCRHDCSFRMRSQCQQHRQRGNC